jgi:hypothetical protein
MSNIICNKDSIITWKNGYTFEIDITLPLRKADIDSIIGDGAELFIRFMNDTGLTIDLPDNLDNLIKVVERGLLRWSGYYEGYGLRSYVIERIINHLKENIDEIKEAIKKAK